MELIGRYEGSGLKDAPFIARRSDGQVIQLPEMLYVLASHIDGRRTNFELAQVLSDRMKRQVEADDVGFLVQEKLLPLGVVASTDGSGPAPESADPILALRFKARAIPAGVVTAVSNALRPTFLPPVILAFVGGLIAFDVWFFAQHGVAQSVRAVLEQPALLFVVFGLLIVSAVFHEFGHATACRYGGATPGVMGVGLYLVWPAFYTDATDAYRLSRAGRVRTDLGGVYFNSIFILAMAGLYFLTGWEVLLAFILIQHFEMLHQFLPFVRLDGYYVVSDLVGVPDLFRRIMPTLRSLVPWVPTPSEVKELKPWARAAVAVWVLSVVPILLFNLTLIALHAPRIFATAWTSIGEQARRVSEAFGNGAALEGAAGVLQIVMLALPALGVALILTSVGKRSAVGAWNWSDGSPARRTAVLSGSTVIAALIVYSWWPSPAYRPIQPTERWTVQEASGQVEDIIRRRRPPSTEEMTATEPVQETPQPVISPTPEPTTSPSPTPDVTDEMRTPRPASTPTISDPATPEPIPGS